MTELPAGMLTLMFTDIEDSTRHWEVAPEEMERALAIHDDLLLRVVEAHDGIVFTNTGDGVGAVFARPNGAALAAVEVQRSLQAVDWPGERLKVRIGLHVGEVAPSGGNYFGPPVNRAVRVMDIANGDQITLTETVGGFIDAVAHRRVGRHLLKGIGTESIEMVDDPDLVVDPRPLRARVKPVVKPLPPRSRPFVGRAGELDELHALLARHRTIGILGPGGVGKTELAVEFARRVEAGFEDGAVLVELGSVTDDDAVLDEVAAALGARAQPDMTLLDSIANFLEGRHLLLVLDNCEHVVDEVSALVTSIRHLPELHVVTTSRVRLRVRDEQSFSLRPLDPDSAGVELFIEHARARDLSFEPDAATRETIRRICERVDGMPLSIKLAAAWVRVLSPAQLLDRLDDQLAVLDRRSDGTNRQSPSEIVRWSYDQLDADQAALFRRLSVFTGGFTLDAAVAVVSEPTAADSISVLEGLMALVDKSMVVTDRGVGDIRFTMLETLRAFGTAELAAEGDEVVTELRRRHAEHCLGLVRDARDRLLSADEAEIWDILDREWTNIRTAFETLIETGDLDAGAELVTSLGWYAGLSMRFEVFVWAEELLATPGIEQRPNASALIGLGALGRYFTIDDRSEAEAERGVELDGDPFGFCHIALAAASLNNRLSAEDSDERTARWLASVGDDADPMNRLWALGMRTFHLANFAPSSEVVQLHDQMKAIAAESGSASAEALARWAGGMVASFQSARAGLEQWERGLDVASSLSDVHLLRHLIVGLELHFTAARGPLEVVTPRCLATIEEARDQHYLAGTSHLFGVTAIILCRHGEEEIAGRLLGSMKANGHLPRENAIAAVSQALGDGRAAAEERGASLSTNDAAQLAVDTLERASLSVTDRG